MISVKYTSTLRRAIGRENDTADADSIASLINILEERYGEIFTKNLSFCHIFVNGSSTEDMNGRNTTLSNGDEVLFLVQVAGG